MQTKNKYLAFFDCETNGYLPTQHSLVAMSCIVADRETITEQARYVGYAKLPDHEEFNWKASRYAHGFSEKELRSFPDPRRTAIDFLNFLKPFKHEDNYPLMFISHCQRSFDALFLENFYINLDLQCSIRKVFRVDCQENTLAMSRQAFPNFDKHGLDSMCEYFNITLNHHEVESDTEACMEIYKRIKDDWAN